jgi:hypothetical protein
MYLASGQGEVHLCCLLVPALSESFPVFAMFLQQRLRLDRRFRSVLKRN